jgi:hypothetical protein
MMSRPDENVPESDTEPLLEAAGDDQEPVEEPRTPGRVAMEAALKASGKALDDLT